MIESPPNTTLGLLACGLPAAGCRLPAAKRVIAKAINHLTRWAEQSRSEPCLHRPRTPATGAPGTDGRIGVRCPPRQKEEIMRTPMPNSVALVSARDAPFAQAQIAAAAYLARYSGRTLETYRYDLRTFFQWCTDVGLDVLEAKRAHIELWRSAMEERAWLPRPSIGGCPPSAASIASPTSTAGSHRTQRSTPAVPRSTRARARRPGRARPVPLHGRTLRPRPCRPGGSAGSERTAGQRGLCHRCRGSRLRPGP